MGREKGRKREKQVRQIGGRKGLRCGGRGVWRKGAGGG